MKFVRTILTLACLCCLSACMLAVPFIQSFKESGFVSGDRAALLKTDLRLFHNAMSDGNRMRLLSYASEDYSDEYKEILRDTDRDERIVDCKVDFIDLAEDAYQAEVDAYVKYFKQPYYVVKERQVREKWKFSVSTGWKLTDFKIVDSDRAMKK